jgi:hypothetical protein
MARLKIWLRQQPFVQGVPQRKAQIISDRGTRVILPFAPVEADLDGAPVAWTQVTRTGRRPLLLTGGGQLKTWSGSILLAYPDYRQSVQHLVNTIQGIAATGDAIQFYCGGPERGRWRIATCSVHVALRVPGTNDAARATVQLGLTEVSDLVAHVSPTSGRAVPPAPWSAYAVAVTPVQRSYRVRPGDTLWSIASKVYGEPDRWHAIADANNIRNPLRLRVGQVLIIP